MFAPDWKLYKFRITRALAEEFYCSLSNFWLPIENTCDRIGLSSIWNYIAESSPTWQDPISILAMKHQEKNWCSRTISFWSLNTFLALGLSYCPVTGFESCSPRAKNFGSRSKKHGNKSGKRFYENFPLPKKTRPSVGCLCRTLRRCWYGIDRRRWFLFLHRSICNISNIMVAGVDKIRSSGHLPLS